MKHAENFAILFWLRKNAPTVDGLYPINCRITIHQERSVFSTGIYVKPSQFNQQFECLKGSSAEAQEANHQLSGLRTKLKDLYFQLRRGGEEVTAQILRDHHLGKIEAEHQRTLLEAFKWHNDFFQQKVNSGSRSKHTMAKYLTTQAKIKAFIPWNFKTADIQLSRIKPSFADDFEHYMTVVDKLQQNSIVKYMRCLKKVMIMAARKEWINRNPIENFQCVYTNPERNYLLMDDLNKLANNKIPGKRLEEVRDCFVFMCYTGFAYQDAADLSAEHLKLMIDGERWLTKPRVKTSVKQSVPLLPVAEKLIEKYKSHPYCQAYNKLMPFNSNQKMNAYLKEVGTICGIPFPLTTHLARHTFATSVTLANGVPLETVKELLGHSNIRTTHIYAKVLSHKVSEDMKNLKLKLAQQVTSKKQRTKKGA